MGGAQSYGRIVTQTYRLRFGGFWRLLQQEGFDQFDRFLEL